MKYYIKFSCGHKDTVEIFGKSEDREKKIRYYEEQGICSQCYKEQREVEKSIWKKEVEMSYREYKEKYSMYETKSGSYDGITKTIVVYLPDIKGDKA